MRADEKRITENARANEKPPTENTGSPSVY